MGQSATHMQLCSMKNIRWFLRRCNLWAPCRRPVQMESASECKHTAPITRTHLEICLARFLAVGATKLHSCLARLCSCCKCSSESGDSLSAHIHSCGGSACRNSPRLRNSFTRRRAMMRFAPCRSWASASVLKNIAHC